MSDLLQYILSQQDQFRRARIPSLFSDFTVQRHTNPDGYYANVNIWEEVLCRAASAGLVVGRDGTVHRLSLETGPYLLQKLESSEWGRPLAINAVIDEAIARRQMLSYHAFLASPHSIYSRSWTELPWRFVAWGLEHMGLRQTVSSKDSRQTRELVLIPNLEKVAGRILTHLEKYNSQVDRTFTTAMFSREAAAALEIDGDLADKDLTVLLKYLSRDRQVLVTDGKVVRIIRSTEVVTQISMEDRAIASLKSLIEDIGRHVHALEAQIASSREKSQKAVETKNRPSALAALRSKKSAESVLAQRMDTLFQLEQVLGSIQQASDQVEMIRVMKDSAGVLRGLNAEVGSALDVENALEGLKEEMGSVEDIGSVISEAGQEINVVDENEIDEEFDALLRQKEKAEEEEAVESTKQRLADLQTEDNIEAEGAKKPSLSTDENPTIPSATSSSASKEHSALENTPPEGEKASSPDSSRAGHHGRESDHAILES
ncbi:MAG: hypothetical protein L6R36_002353 [Xanthoria steineri]|nr:MAG: hypothetical protein L6R36_002353 [Xanthoria steineri]